jgi:hypothetical protein
LKNRLASQRIGKAANSTPRHFCSPQKGQKLQFGRTASMTATSCRIAKDGLGNDGSDHGFIIATKVAILKTATVVLG